MPSAVTHFYSGQPMHFYSGVDKYTEAGEGLQHNQVVKGTARLAEILGLMWPQ